MIVGTLVGTITGLLGTAFTAWNTRKMKALDIEDKKLDRKHELDMVKANTEAMIKEVEANIKITETEIAGEIEKSDVDMFAQVQQLGNKDLFKESYWEKLSTSKFGGIVSGILAALFGIVDVIRGLMRPGITTALIYIMYGYLQDTKVVDPIALDYITGLTTTAVVWWFGHRALTNNTKTKQ